jgi:glutamyl-tRNA synthetase
LAENLEALVRGYALRDAVKHGGRASVGSVMSMLLGDHPELRPRAREIAAMARRIVEEVNRLSVEEQERELAERYPHLAVAPAKARGGGEGERRLPPLPGAEVGKVRLRFAPNPDFLIHLGNARPAILNDEYAKMYKGTMILRFEDTDPRTKKPMKEAYTLIKEDLRWLGVEWHEEYIQSLRMDLFYSVAREMIARGCAYVDDCGERGKELLASGSYCPRRDEPPEVNLELFDKMLAGEFGEGEAVVRVKTDPRHPNPSLGDWVALRIIDTEKHPHPLTGSKYIVWPTYNFAVSVDDHEMRVTHVLRGKEHELNTEKQLYVYRCMEWKPPVFIHFGRLKLEGFILSKSQIKSLLEKNPGAFMGLDDPRFGTIAGLRRRGILPEAIREVILSVGVKPTDATISWANLASINRRILDKRADRIMFVWDPVELRVEGLGGCMDAEVPYHPERPEKRRIRVCDGDTVVLNRSDAAGEVRLMGLANFKVEGSALRFTGSSLEEARRRKLPIVQWVKLREAVRALVLEPEGLELKRIEGLAEGELRRYGVDSRLQFVRFGFVRVDSAGDEYTLILTHR